MIDTRSAKPYYIQIADKLMEQINTGVYKPGDKLPSEKDMCNEYGVSRITVRQALNLLVQKKIVSSVYGKGTFVKAPEITHDLKRIVRFGTALQQKGLTGHTEILSFSPTVVHEAARRQLGCDVSNLNLIGFVQDTPAVLYKSFIREDISQRMYETAMDIEKEKIAFSSFDLYDRMGIHLSRVDQTISAVNADGNLKKLLGPMPSDALIVLESVYYSSTGEPLEYKIGYYRPDIYIFKLMRDL